MRVCVHLERGSRGSGPHVEISSAASNVFVEQRCGAHTDRGESEDVAARKDADEGARRSSSGTACRACLQTCALKRRTVKQHDCDIV